MADPGAGPPRNLALVAILAALVGSGVTLGAVEVAGGSLGPGPKVAAPVNQEAQSGASTAPRRVRSVPGLAVSGQFGSAPTVSVRPGTKPPSNPEVAVLVRGPGRALAAGDLVIADDLGRTWRTSTTFENTYVLGEPPDAFPVTDNELGKALIGVPVGSRVVIVVPAAEGFAGAGRLPTGVRHNDTAVLVVDLVGSYKPDQGPDGTLLSDGGGGLPSVSGKLDKPPTVRIPKSPPPGKLEVKTLVKGTGPQIEPEQLVITQYVGVNWRSGAVFSSTWQRRSPTAYLLGSGEAVPAWETALPGVTIGSRILMVVPPTDGYGAHGDPSLGIKPTDTIVFVVDVLGSYGT